MGRVWVIAPFDFRYRDEWEEIWKYDLDNGVISLGWGRMEDVSSLSLDKILQKFSRTYGDESTAGAHMLNKFYNIVEPGHTIVARRGTKSIAAIGTVKRKAYFNPKKHQFPYERGYTYWNHLEVKWNAAPRDIFFENITFGIQAVQEMQEDRFHALTDFIPIDAESADLADGALDDLIRNGRLRIGIVPTNSPQALVRRRRGMQRLRKLTLENYGTRCAVCDILEPEMLVTSHVVGWAAAPDHQGKLSNVICLCRIHDAVTVHTLGSSEGGDSWAK